LRSSIVGQMSKLFNEM